MIHFVFKDKKSIIFIIVLIIFQGVLGASVSLYISMLVDFLTNQNELKTFLIYVLIGVGIILLLFLIEYMLNKLIIKYSLNVSLSIRNDFINKLIDRNLSSLIQKEPSYFTSFVFNDLPKLCLI